MVAEAVVFQGLVRLCVAPLLLLLLLLASVAYPQQDNTSVTFEILVDSGFLEVESSSMKILSLHSSIIR